MIFIIKFLSLFFNSVRYFYYKHEITFFNEINYACLHMYMYHVMGKHMQQEAIDEN